jgi:hypothetical protein
MLRLKLQILPTLISMCVDSPSNLRILHSELSPKLLTDFLSKMISIDSSIDSAAKYSETLTELKSRIPRVEWEAIISQLK